MTSTSAFTKITPQQHLNDKWFCGETRRNSSHLSFSWVQPWCFLKMVRTEQFPSITASPKYQLSCRHWFFLDLWFPSLGGSCFHSRSRSFIVLALSSVVLFRVTVSYPKVKQPAGGTCPIAITSAGSPVVILPFNSTSSFSFYFNSTLGPIVTPGFVP